MWEVVWTEGGKRHERLFERRADAEVFYLELGFRGIADAKLRRAIV